MKLIERPVYIEKLKSVVGTPDIKVITGIRRSGKSKLLLFLREYLEKDDQNHLVHIDLNLEENEFLFDRTNFSQFVRSHHVFGKRNILLVDEIQNVEHFERTLNSLHAEELFDIFVTGSNAFMLSSDLATLFTGRVFEIEVKPFSFEEYCRYFGRSDTQKAFDDYVYLGGFAGAYVYSKQSDQYTYIKKEIFDTIVQRDIVQKYKIRNKAAFLSLCEFMMDNIGNPCSSLSILKAFKNSATLLSDKTINKYLSFICHAFLFYKVDRYDLKGKKYLSTENKYYLSDIGLRYATLGTRNLDLGRCYENLVFLELKRRGYDVFIGKIYTKEIDFIATKQNEKIYIQVSYSLDNEATRLREIAPLKAISDAYPKMIIARTQRPDYDIDGIQIIDIAQWLLKIPSSGV